MITRNIKTIQEHEEKVGNRYSLAHLVMKRTKQLMNGARPSKGLSEEFRPKRQGEIPNQSFPKVALEEIRTGKLAWHNPSKKPVATLPPLDSEIVFGS